jgi:hypothetical protein
MQESPTLVVSDPPHGEVDVEAIANLLGLDVPGTRLKAEFPAPEVLSASEPGEAAEFGASLRGAGLTIAILDGGRLSAVPWPMPVSSVAFEEEGLTVGTSGGEIRVPYDVPVVGVYCSPPPNFSMTSPVDAAEAVARGDGPAIAEAIQWMANLDLYFTQDGVLRRISIVPELAGSLSIGAVMDECRRRFQSLHLDTRLENVRPRARFIMGEAGFDPDQRKRYSFGTLLLCHILDSISPELRDVPQYELGSRMGYALSPMGTKSA